MLRDDHTYQADLALVHDLGFGFHGDRCAPGIRDLLEPVRRRGGLVLELGCGSGSLTRHLLAAGHRVLATDGSPAMVARARAAVPAAQVRRLVLPDDRLPPVDAVVGVGNVLNYLRDEAEVERALTAIAAALRPDGVLALDLVDRRWGEDPRHLAPMARVRPSWAVFATSALPDPGLLVRDFTTFVRSEDGGWRRADERHEIRLLQGQRVADHLRESGVTVTVNPSFGAERLRAGMVAVIGRRMG